MQAAKPAESMQSYANFTVGGSVSVNAHGRYVGHGPVGRSVRALQLVLADGSLVEAGPDTQPELFRAAIGGYGAVGIITEVSCMPRGSSSTAPTRTPRSCASCGAVWTRPAGSATNSGTSTCENGHPRGWPAGRGNRPAAATLVRRGLFFCAGQLPMRPPSFFVIITVAERGRAKVPPAP